MASNTYTALATQTVTGSPVASVTFSSIPQGYTDLILIANGMSDGVNADAGLRFNGVSTTTYSRLYLYGSGSAASTGTTPNTTYSQNMNFSNVSNETNIVHIFNYSNSSVYKTMLSSTADAASLGVVRQSSTWRNTAAITSIEVLMAGTSKFAVGTTFTIYGIAAVPQLTAKATGGTIYYGADGYVYHKFTSSGTFTPSQALTADILVVAGGGGGATSVGGGGGGGGLLAFSAQALSATGYTVTVGSGGAAVGSNSQGNTGNDSQFGALTLVKGGGGGGSYAAGTTGKTGGSGGGAGGWAPPATGGSATSGQGNAGGSVTGGTYGSGGSGGGGGAGGVGQTYSSGSVGSSGGPGSNTYSSWNQITNSGVLYNGSYYLAAGGPGVFGAGGTQASASYGTVAFGAAVAANTGQGGCGDYGYAGSDGLVIVRYLG